MFHICDEGRKVSFLCPNGTIFQQSDLICDWWFKVDCSSSPLLYEESAEQLQEENHKRKEARRQYELKQVEDSRQRLQHIESRSEEKTSRENLSRRRPSSRETINHNSIAKKDINNDVGNFGTNSEKKPEKVYKETQVLAETASFVNKKFSEQPYFKNINDVGGNKVAYLPQRTHADNRATKQGTDKGTNRGGKSFESTLTTTVKPYRGRNNDYLKTTTQHTIYSPTVPPITATKYTTKIPSTRPIQTTTFQTTTTTSTEPTTITTTTPTSFNGFYITKVAEAATNNPEIFGRRETTTVTPTQEEYTTRTISDKIDSAKTARDLEKSFTTYDFTKYDFTSKRTTQNPTTPYRTVYTTITPTGFSSTATTEAYKQTTRNEKSTTTHFSKYTYLPNSTPNSIIRIRPTNPTPYTAYTTQPSIADNLSNMIKTLQNLDSQDPSMDIEKLLASRPGLSIPPSAGPNTLHSLAVYFATALDNLVSNDTDVEIATTTESPPSTITEEDRLVTLLSRSTVDKYNLLFNENQEENEKNDNADIKSLVEHDAKYNDLDGQQSQGPLAGAPRIRQLAQVFTQALSAYLDDPETFKRVLEEIRPTEPPQGEIVPYDLDINTESSQAYTTEFASYTKEEDEVLDFSDTDKSTTHSTTTATDTPTKITEKPFLNEISTSFPDDREPLNVHRDSRAQTINSLAVDLNNNLRYTTRSTTTEQTTQSSYFPVPENEQNEDAQKRLTAKPYGFGVKPSDSSPITDIPQNTVNLASSWTRSSYNQINKNLSEFQPFDALLPPYETTKTSYNSSKNFREEYLQSAHSQSFVAHGNSITNSNRKGKAVFGTEATDKPRTEAYHSYTTVQTDISTTPFTEELTTYSTPTTDVFREYTTTESTTQYPTTQNFISSNHWSQSPIVTKLWETTLYVNPLIINRNLDVRSESDAVSEDVVSTTESYETSTHQTTTELYTSTTEDPTTTETPETIFPNYHIPSQGINNLLNTTELEIASTQANQLFGNLGILEQDLLMEKMKMAESNSTVRRLILLLVSTCDASLNQNKTVQETRNYILHALLGIPVNKTFEASKIEEPTTNLPPFETTQTTLQQKPLPLDEPLPEPQHIKSRSGKALKNDNSVNSITTQAPQESTTLEIVTSSKSYIITDKKLTTDTQQVPINKELNVKNVHQNTRALELLRSLYSLAAKWTNK